MSDVTQPLRDEHRELLPHIERLRALADGIGDSPRATLRVGGLDDTVIELNRQAYEELKTEKHLEIVPGATHLFEEPGTLHEVARLAGQWFGRCLGQKREV